LFTEDLKILLKDFLFSCKKTNAVFYYKKIRGGVIGKKKEVETKLLAEFNLLESNKKLVFCIFIPTLFEKDIFFNFFIGLEEKDSSLKNFTCLDIDSFEKILEAICNKSVFLDESFLTFGNKKHFIAPKIYSYSENELVDESYVNITEYLLMHYRLNIEYGTFNIKKGIAEKNFIKNFIFGFLVATALLVIFVVNDCVRCNPPKPEIFETFCLKKLLYKNAIIFHTPVNIEGFVNHATAIIENKNDVKIKIGVYDEFRNTKKIRLSKEGHPHICTYLENYKNSYSIFQELTHIKFNNNLKFNMLSEVDLLGYQRSQYLSELFSIDNVSKFDFDFFDGKLTEKFVNNHGEQIINNNINGLKELLTEIKRECFKTTTLSKK
jgi:hypothetical protein